MLLQCSPLQHRPQHPILPGLVWAKVRVITTREVSHEEEEGRRYDRSDRSDTSTRPAEDSQVLTVKVLSGVLQA